ncbi:MAG: hypothetical protein U5K54_08170 [Cytophagales bacterium]|nr:hypothetical protein [Cytophagales bacterium]
MKSRAFYDKPCSLQALEVCAYNINRKQKDLKLYEFGKIYWKNRSESRSQHGGIPYLVKKRELALYLTGNYESENWQHQSKPVNLF